MPDFSIIEARTNHCGQMVRLLRHEHQLAVAQIGMNSHRELHTLFHSSSFRRAWLIDGKLAALGGVSGTKMAATGFIWLLLSQNATRYPIAIIKEARKQLDEIMKVKRELATTILGGDEAAKRLAIFLGFHVSHEGSGQEAHSRFGRRDLARHVTANTDLRITVGNGYAIPMGFHHDHHEVA